MRSNSFIQRQSQAALVEKYRMIGESEAFLDTMSQVSAAARVNRPVLIIGERGTGKELVAARLHYLSPRWQQPKIAINCAAFNPGVLEAEIFGHEQGAFTGANRSKKGRFEMAHQGSLFLDELAQSPMVLQEKLLRVLEYQEFERVGGTETISVDVRVIAATNQDLPTLCEEGKFREDLLDRLSFEVITLPPLRYRQEDIAMLISTFALRMAREMELPKTPTFSSDAIESLLDYSWPGNIRELKNVVERAVYRCGVEVIEEIDFDPFNSPYRPTRRIGHKQEQYNNVVEVRSDLERFDEALAVPEGEDLSSSSAENLPEAIEELERKMVGGAMTQFQYNQKRAAEHLGLSYYQLRRLLKRLNIQ